MKNKKKIFTITISALSAFFVLFIVVYLFVIPALISNKTFIKFVQNNIKQVLHADFLIENPVLKTSLNPRISFSFDNLSLTQNNDNLLDVKKFETEISLKKLYKKNFVVKKLGADYIYADIEKITELFPQKEEKSAKKSDWSIDLFRSLLYIKDCVILYNTNNDFKMKIIGKDLKIEAKRDPKPFNFNLVVELEKNNKKMIFKLEDNNSVFTNKDKLLAKNTEFFINKSKIVVNYTGKKDRTFELNLHSNNFNFADVEDIIKSNVFIPNGSQMMASLENMKGDFDFDVNINKQELNGKININSLNFTLPDMKGLPIAFKSGEVIISKDKIKINKFKGFHGKNKSNEIDLDGVINDYTKSFNTNIISYIVLTKEFTNSYLTPLIGYPIELVGKTKAKLKFNMLNGVIDTSIIFRLVNGSDILLDGMSFTPTTYQRAFRADVKIDGNNIELTNLNYYIAKSFTAGVVAKPLVRMYGNFDAKGGTIKNMGFEIPKPLKSEFMNAIFKQRIFKDGYISGNLEYIVNNSVPYLKGDLKMDKVKIPSQRMFINGAELISNGKLVKLSMNGRYKRSEYDFVADVLNEVKTPFIIKNTNLNIDNLDIERVMKTVNNMPQNQEQNITEKLADTPENQAKSDEEVSFNTDNFIIEKGVLKIVKGVYKQIDFGNVLATMTLDKNGILNLSSNRFDIAEGVSSAKINFDFKKQLYNIRLGILDVNSDIIATSLLDLPKEISGKARGLIKIETDKSLKLNGEIKFNIKNGNIAKVGLIEYALNFVSVFRNPLAMISPATIMDLVNIPEGEFDKIEGTLKLKDNAISMMMIKSYAPHLSSFIVGRYDLENADATLRIYTKFTNKHKGLAGVLRHISLNSFANTLPLSLKNETNYYSLELSQIPEIDAPEKDCQVFLTKIDGDVEKNNFLSTLKRIK